MPQSFIQIQIASPGDAAQHQAVFPERSVLVAVGMLLQRHEKRPAHSRSRDHFENHVLKPSPSAGPRQAVLWSAKASEARCRFAWGLSVANHPKAASRFAC